MSPARKPTKVRSAAGKSSRKATAARGAAKRKTVARKKPVGKKAGAKKITAKKTAARKKPVAKKPVAKKPAAKKTAAKKPVGKKPVGKKTTAKKPVGKKPEAKKTVAKKTAARSVARGGIAPMAPPAYKAPVQPKRAARPMKLDKTILAQIRAQLEKEYEELQKQYDELDRESFEGTQSELTGEVGLDEDFADAGSATFERERALSIQNNIQDLMDQMTRAVRRIQEGTYGSCERCGRPIDAPRLRALPHASLCMDCKRREERLR